MTDETAAWHALFAPLPADVLPQRQPIAPPEVLARPDAAAIAGWEQISIFLSAGAAGLRHVLVVLDGDARPLSASDMLLHRRIRPGAPTEEAIEHIHESVGGRLEPDGTFLGTRWRTVSVMAEDDEEPMDGESTPSAPSAADIAALKALVDEVLRRAQVQQ